jgi:1-pyrroline-5-carboxylate dehydrogenase
VPLVINGKEEHSNEVKYQFSVSCLLKQINLISVFLLFQPYNHAHKVAQFSWATKKQINNAIETGIAARNRWDRVPLKLVFALT